MKSQWAHLFSQAHLSACYLPVYHLSISIYLYLFIYLPVYLPISVQFICAHVWFRLCRMITHFFCNLSLHVSTLYFNYASIMLFKTRCAVEQVVRKCNSKLFTPTVGRRVIQGQALLDSSSFLSFLQLPLAHSYHVALLYLLLWKLLEFFFYVLCS